MNHTLGNGWMVNATERETRIIANSVNPATNRLDPPAAAAALVDFFGEDLTYRALGPQKGEWRYWTGKKWDVYHGAVLHRDVSWLLGHVLLADLVSKIVNTMGTRLSIPWTVFDSKPLVTLTNCVLRIEDNKIVRYEAGHKREDYCTHLLPVALKDSSTPKWQAHLDLVAPDPDDQKTIEEMIGYCFCPAVQRQVFFALKGEAHTGKSTILALLSDMLGADLVSAVKLSSLHESHATCSLIGKMVNIDTEAEYLKPEAEGLLKAITGGDPIHMNPKFLPGFDMTLPVKMVLSSNELPRFSDRTDGLWSRLVQIPFSTPIPAEKRRQMSDVLADFRDEHGGILARALKRLSAVLQRGTRATAFTQSAAAKAATEDHRHQSNPFLDWFDETLELSPDAAVEKKHIYGHYRIWCHTNGFKALASSSFGREMCKVKGVRSGRPHRGARTYCGVELKTEPMYEREDTSGAEK